MFKSSSNLAMTPVIPKPGPDSVLNELDFLKDKVQNLEG